MDPTSHQVPDDSMDVQDGEDEDPSLPEPEPQQQVDPALQVCHYILEMFSVPLLQSHATVSLIDHNHLQLYHTNHSVILVSSAIKFSDGGGKDKLITTIIAFHCLLLEQNGILETLVPLNAKLLSKTKFKPAAHVVQRGNVLHFLGNGKHGLFEVILAGAISHNPAIVGRSTLVLNATSEQWQKKPLVVKISWPSSGWASETEFLEKAITMARDYHAWAANHLPKVYYVEDIVFHLDSSLKSVAHLFENAEFAGGDYTYKWRTLCIIIQEQLYPLKSLVKVKDISQVFLDIVCGMCIPFRFSIIIHLPPSSSLLAPQHPWHPLLQPQFQQHHMPLHQGEERQRGNGEESPWVLTDYNLSSWTACMNPNYTKTLQQHTGTLPYMAQELLKGMSPLHLYRHDVGMPYDWNSQEKKEPTGSYANVDKTPIPRLV